MITLQLSLIEYASIIIGYIVLLNFFVKCRLFFINGNLNFKYFKDHNKIPKELYPDRVSQNLIFNWSLAVFFLCIAGICMFYAFYIPLEICGKLRPTNSECPEGINIIYRYADMIIILVMIPTIILFGYRFLLALINSARK